MIANKVDRTPALRNPIKGYRRHRAVLDNLIVAAVLALAVYGAWAAGAPLGIEWGIVVALAVLVLGTQNRAWGYYAAVAASFIPLWQLSPVLTVLFATVALLPRRWVVGHLPAVLLVAAAPLLSEWHVPGVAPLLAGMAGGPALGFGVGVASALWLKILAALGDLPAELGALHGLHISWNAIATHTRSATPLEMIGMPVAPFFAGGNAFLLHALQAAGWGMAGWLVAKVRGYLGEQGAPRFAIVPPLACGSLLLWVTLFLLPAWLAGQSLWPVLTEQRLTAGVALASVTAAFLSTVLERIRAPVAQQAPRPGYSRRRTREGMVYIPANAKAHTATSTGRTRPEAPVADEDEGVILLEFD
jgi:hypothetical protein